MSKSRYTFASILGYGDALISLQLLQQASPFPAPLRIAGTAITQDVQTAIKTDLSVTRVLPDHAAFFRIRAAGFRRCVEDIRAFRRWSESALSRDDSVLFEKRDFRNHLILGRCGARIIEPETTDSSYVDRKNMIERVTGRKLVLADCHRPAAGVRSVLINPSARARHREIPTDVMQNLVTIFRRRGIRVSITDPAKQFADISSLFDQYLGRLDLADAMALMRGHDLHIGPDSFFIHVAYYLRVPFFTILPWLDFDFYFAPPGSKGLGNFIALPVARDPSKLELALGNFLGW